MAFREANSVEEGAKYIDQAWSKMWTEIAEEIKKLPAMLRDKVGDTVKILTGLPLWAWITIGVGTLAVVGGGIYALANTRAGAAVAKKFVP
jgi:muconolactone delta-isomerase